MSCLIESMTVTKFTVFRTMIFFFVHE